MNLLKYVAMFGLVTSCVGLFACSGDVAGTTEDENTVIAIDDEQKSSATDSSGVDSSADMKNSSSSSQASSADGKIDVVDSSKTGNVSVSSSSGAASALSSESVDVHVTDLGSSSANDSGSNDVPSGSRDVSGWGLDSGSGDAGGNAGSGWGAGGNFGGDGFGGQLPPAKCFDGSEPAPVAVSSSSSVTEFGNAFYVNGAVPNVDILPDSLFSARVAKLVDEGMSEAEAKQQTLDEIYRLFGIDDVESFRRTTLKSYTVKRAVGYIIAFISRYEYPLFKDYFVNNGVVEDSLLCRFSIVLSLSDVPKVAAWLIPQGCNFVDREFEEIYWILENIWTRCVDVPVCDASLENTKMEVASQLSVRETIVCWDSMWVFPTVMEYELHYKLCTKDGDRVKSESRDGVFYICYDGEWYMSGQGTEALPVEYGFNPDFDYGTFTDPRDGNVYRTTIFRGKTWLSQNINYYDKNDTMLVKYSLCASEANNGNGNENWTCEHTGRYYTADAAHHACPDGWRLPLKSDWDELTAMEYSVGKEYFPKLFSKLEGEFYTDEFGLSLRYVIYIDAKGSYGTGRTAYFWTEKSVIAELTLNSAGYIVITGSGHGPYAPVRCLKD